MRCRYVTYVPYDVLYNDSQLRLKIMLSHPEEDGDVPTDSLPREFLNAFYQDWVFRLVRCAGELGEKIKVIEDGYSDIELEVLKLFVSEAQQLDLSIPLVYVETARAECISAKKESHRRRTDLSRQLNETNRRVVRGSVSPCQEECARHRCLKWNVGLCRSRICTQKAR